VCCAVQNGLWDDLTETDELMSTAMSFSGSQLAAKTAAAAAGRAKKSVDPLSHSTALLMSTANTTCRSYHSQGHTTLSLSQATLSRRCPCMHVYWPVAEA